MFQLLFYDWCGTDGIGNNAKDEAIIVSTIVLGIKLGCSTIAEGVENERQLHFLKQHGCE
ncbi:MAG: EAL domain-containing protein [Firmicutes bacterium]|nr:EAL domain-containing protein [Bacillota bacterium]